MEHERNSPYELLPETGRLLRDVETVTGRSTVVRPDARVADRGRALYAVSDANESRHLVLYDPKKERFLDALIGHEAGHILRFAQAPASERKVLVLTEEARRVAVRALTPELSELARTGVHPRALVDVLPIWLSGTVAQLSDTPADINIERWLWDRYPGIREVQRASLEDQARELQGVLHPRVEAVTPRSIWLASNAMNYALLRSVSQLLGQPSLVRPYLGTPAQSLGDILLNLEGREDAGFVGDRECSRRWASAMGFESWLTFKTLDELPAHFRHTWE